MKVWRNKNLKLWKYVNNEKPFILTGFQIQLK